MADARHDSDGIPPGLDLGLVGLDVVIRFSGIFYVAPKLGNVELLRVARIVFASKEVYVAQDHEHGNLYVVDRAKRLSLGCRMTADYFMPNEVPPPVYQRVAFKK